MRRPGPLVAALRRVSEGVTALDWPFERLARGAAARGTPVFDEATCTGCGECVDACTARCLTAAPGAPSVGPPRLDAGPCVRCGMCEAVCPEDAVRLAGPVEVAAFARDDLRLGPGEPPAERRVGPPPSALWRRAVGMAPSREVDRANLLEGRLAPLRGRARRRVQRRRRRGAGPEARGTR